MAELVDGAPMRNICNTRMRLVPVFMIVRLRSGYKVRWLELSAHQGSTCGNMGALRRGQTEDVNARGAGHPGTDSIIVRFASRSRLWPKCNGTRLLYILGVIVPIIMGNVR